MANGNGDGTKSQGRTLMWIVITAVVTAMIAGVIGFIAYFIEGEIDEVNNARHRDMKRLEERINRLEELHLK